MNDVKMLEDLKLELSIQEGFEPKPYKCSMGYNTIGFGRNLDTVGISKDESYMLLENDITKAYNTLVSNMPWVHALPYSAQKALTNMCFQLGYAGLSKFRKMLTAIQEQRWDDAILEAEDSLWASQTPKRFTYVKELFTMCKGY